MLIFSEILPKTFFRQKANETISALEKPIALSARMFAPVITVTTFFSQLLLGRRSKGLQVRKSPFVSREELKYLVRESEKEGVVEPQERLFIQSIFNLDKRKIRQVMVELKQTVLLRDSAGYQDIRALIKKGRRNRNAAVTTSRLGAYHRLCRGHVVLQRQDGGIPALQGASIRATGRRHEGPAGRGSSGNGAHEGAGPPPRQRTVAERHDADDRMVRVSLSGATGDPEGPGPPLHVEAHRRRRRGAELESGDVVALAAHRVPQIVHD